MSFLRRTRFKSGNSVFWWATHSTECVGAPPKGGNFLSSDSGQRRASAPRVVKQDPSNAWFEVEGVILPKYIWARLQVPSARNTCIWWGCLCTIKLASGEDDHWSASEMSSFMCKVLSSWKASRNCVVLVLHQKHMQNKSGRVSSCPNKGRETGSFRFCGSVVCPNICIFEKNTLTDAELRQ